MFLVWLSPHFIAKMKPKEMKFNSTVKVAESEFEPKPDDLCYGVSEEKYTEKPEYVKLWSTTILFPALLLLWGLRHIATRCS